jgi:chemotaxis signal transduction protein
MEGRLLASERAAQLRRNFDDGFAVPARADIDAQEDLLAVRLGARGFALRLSEIAGLFADKKVTHVPGSDAALRGVAGFRGSIVAVYDMARLLGYSTGESSRWIVLAATASVAFTFETYEGQRRVAADAFKSQLTQAGHKHATQFIRDGALLRPVIQIASMLDAIGG